METQIAAPVDQKAEFEKQDIQQSLAEFHGTENLTRISAFAPQFLCTDGVKFLADRCKSYWLLDLIVSWQTKSKVRAEPFQVWELHKGSRRDALITCTDGREDSLELCRQHVQYTDFPLDEVKLYLEYGGLDPETPAWILMLPNER